MAFKFDDTFYKIKDADDNLVDIWEAFRNDIYTNDQTLLTSNYIKVYINSTNSGSFNLNDCEDPTKGCSFSYLITTYLPTYISDWFDYIPEVTLAEQTHMFDLSDRMLIIDKVITKPFAVLKHSTPVGFSGGTILFTPDMYIIWETNPNKIYYIGSNASYPYWNGTVFQAAKYLYFENVNMIFDSAIGIFHPIITAKNTTAYFTDRCVLTDHGAGFLLKNDNSTSIIIDKLVLNSRYGYPTPILNNNPNYKLFAANIIGFTSNTNSLTENTVETYHFNNNINNRIVTISNELYADKPLYTATTIKHLAPLSASVDENNKRNYILTDYHPINLE